MPISGMTGFGRAEGANGAWTWAVEARSVNGRNLETRFRGPPGFDGLERLTREGAQARFQRGNITVGVQAKRTGGAGFVRINHNQIERYLAAGAPYIGDGRVQPPRLDGLLALRGVIEAEDAGLEPEVVAELEAAMSVSINAAMDALLASRRGEGAALFPVLDSQVTRIGNLTQQAGEVAAEQPAALKARYEARLTELGWKMGQPLAGSARARHCPRAPRATPRARPISAVATRRRAPSPARWRPTARVGTTAAPDVAIP